MGKFKRGQLPTAAAEAEIIREIEELIRKLAAGQASPQEIQLLQDLQKRRVELMRPLRLPPLPPTQIGCVPKRREQRHERMRVLADMEKELGEWVESKILAGVPANVISAMLEHQVEVLDAALAQQNRENAGDRH
jgi:hypothetical protein